jgi:hypothetical protein
LISALEGALGVRQTHGGFAVAGAGVANRVLRRAKGLCFFVAAIPAPAFFQRRGSAVYFYAWPNLFLAAAGKRVFEIFMCAGGGIAKPRSIFASFSLVSTLAG